MFLCASAPACLIACDTVKYGSWWLSKGTPAEVLYKGTITRIIGEDSPSRAEKVREDALPKGHVIYEGKKGHVLSYDGKSEPAASRAGAAVLGFREIFEARLATCDGMTSQVHFQRGFSPPLQLGFPLSCAIISPQRRCCWHTGTWGGMPVGHATP